MPWRISRDILGIYRGGNSVSLQPWTPAALIGGPSPGIQGAPCTQHPRPSLPTPQVLGSAVFFLVKRTLSPVPAAAGRSLRRSSEEPQDWSRRAARQREPRLPGLRGRGPGRGRGLSRSRGGACPGARPARSSGPPRGAQLLRLRGASEGARGADRLPRR